MGELPIARIETSFLRLKLTFGLDTDANERRLTRPTYSSVLSIHQRPILS
jgi:hypothetical protein